MWIALNMLKWCFDEIHEFLSYDWEHVDWELFYVMHVVMKVYEKTWDEMSCMCDSMDTEHR
jgi:hypothetical protein